MNNTEIRVRHVDRSDVAGRWGWYDAMDQMFPVNAVRICFDLFDHDVQGRVYSPMSRHAILFRDCGEMFLKADALFDRKGYPQAFQEKRSFQNISESQGCFDVPKSLLTEEEIMKQRGRIHTLDVLVQSRRYTGWQGKVLSCDRNFFVLYKSELELLKYIYGELQRAVMENSVKR